MNTITNPTPQQIRAARRAAGLSQTSAGKLVYAALRTWQQWEREPPDRRMPMAAWELFQIKAKKYQKTIDTDNPITDNTSDTSQHTNDNNL